MVFSFQLFPVHHYMLSPTSLVGHGPPWEIAPFIHYAPLKHTCPDLPTTPIQNVSNTPLFDVTATHLSTALDYELFVGSSVKDQPMPLVHAMVTRSQMC